MVSVLASSAECHGFDSQPGQIKDIKIALAASPLSTWHLVVRAKTRRPNVRILFLFNVTCLPGDCCFRDLARYIS